MTKSELDAIKARCEAAKKCGPGFTFPMGYMRNGVFVSKAVWGPGDKVPMIGEVPAEVLNFTNEALDDIPLLIAEVERLSRALGIAAGYISGTEGFTDKHPMEVLKWLELKVEALGDE